MSKTILACLFFSLTVSTASAQLISNIVAPAPFQVVDSTLNISVNLIPNDPSLNVKAWVGSRSTTLAIDEQNSIGNGSLSISGLVQDTLTLFAAAADASLNTDTVSVRFIYDLPPVLSVQRPLNWSNARPTLPVHAICKDNSTCTITLSVGMNGGASAFFGTFTDSLSTTVDLSAFDGNFGTLYFTATDSRGQHDSKGAQILVDNSPYLQEVFAAQDQIIDFNYNKVFVPSSVLEGPGSKTRIVDITTHDSTILPNNIIEQAFITPFGALLGIQDSTNPSITWVGDWNRDSLYNLGGTTE